MHKKSLSSQASGVNFSFLISGSKDLMTIDQESGVEHRNVHKLKL